MSEVEDALRSVLAEQLGVRSIIYHFSVSIHVLTSAVIIIDILVPPSIISGGSPDGHMITTMERDSSESQPLVQVYIVIISLTK